MQDNRCGIGVLRGAKLALWRTVLRDNKDAALYTTPDQVGLFFFFLFFGDSGLGFFFGGGRVLGFVFCCDVCGS